MSIWRPRPPLHFTIFPLQRHSILPSFSFSSSSSSSSQPHLPSSSNGEEEEEALISSVVSILTEQPSKSRWNFLKSLHHPTGFSPTQFSQIALRIRNKPHLALRFFRWSQHNSICNHNLFSLSTVIHLLARSRCFRTQTQTLIQTAVRADGGGDLFRTLTKTYSSCDSAPFVFDLLILAYVHGKDIDRAVEIARTLRPRGIYPSAGTCNSVIRVAARSRGAVAGFEVYREIFGLELDVGTIDAEVRVSPNVQTFNALMLSFYREQKMEGVGEMRCEMEKFGCEPNVFSYSVLIAAACDGGKMEDAVSLWDEMRDRGIKPDIMCYNTLIGGFCEMGEVEKAELLFREIMFGEMEPTCATFEHLITGYCKTGDVDTALVLYKDMCRRDFRPEAPTVDAVVGELCRTNQVFEGLRFLKEVKRRGAFYPNRGSYDVLIKSFCDAGEMEEALKIQAEMVGRGFEPDLETYNSFVEGYRKQGDIEKAMKLRTEMLEMGLRQEDENEQG